MSETLAAEIITAYADWGVLDKAPGYSVHNEPGRDVLSFLQKKFPKATPSLPHRLDQETSGVLIFALNPKTHTDLQIALSTHESSKKYLALVRGEMKTAPASWTWPLSDKAEGRKNPQGLSTDRKPCETRVQIQRQNSYFTILECEILTGRQHQIRKHAALAKHPLVGDSRYNEKSYNEKIAKLYETDRLFLHAQSLVFQFQDHPYIFESPTPDEFSRLIPTSGR